MCKLFELLVSPVDTGLIIKNDQKSLKILREEIYMNLIEFSDCSTSYWLDKSKMM